MEKKFDKKEKKEETYKSWAKHAFDRYRRHHVEILTVNTISSHAPRRVNSPGQFVN